MSYEPLAMMEVSDLTWPVAYRYHISGPFGGSQFELCVDAPSLDGNLEATKRLAPLLWVTGIAPAICTSVQCEFIEVVQFKVSEIPVVTAPSGLQGNRLGPALGRSAAGVLGFHSGHHDRYGMKRWYAAGMPASWASGGILTTAGAETLQQVARAWIAGTGTDAGATDPVLLTRHPRVVPRLEPTPFANGFRYVRHVRVMQYTSPVPEPGNLIWP